MNPASAGIGRKAGAQPNQGLWKCALEGCCLLVTRVYTAVNTWLAMICASQNRIRHNRHLQLLPALSPAAVPLGLLLLLLAADSISGEPECAQQRWSPLKVFSSGVFVYYFTGAIRGRAPTGQGLILRRQDLGASNKPENVQLTQQYLLARAKASQLLGRVRSLSQPCGSGSSCRGCLCGWDVTS